MIHAVCTRLAGNPADGADATQEALIAIVRGLPRFDGRASVRTWMYRVATNACLDELRRRGRRPVLGLPENVTDRSDDAPGLDAAVAERLSIDEALAELPEEFRVAVVLRDVEGHGLRADRGGARGAAGDGAVAHRPRPSGPGRSPGREPRALPRTSK